MKLKKITSTALIFSSLISAYPVSSFAETGDTGVGQNSPTSDVLLEISVLKQKASEIENLKASLATRQSLETKIPLMKTQLDSLNSEIENLPMTSDIVTKHTQLVSQRDLMNDTLNELQKQLATLPDRQSLQENLQSDQKDYDLRKSWLTDPQKRDLEKHEVQLRIAMIEQKQKELANIQQEIATAGTDNENRLPYFLVSATFTVFTLFGAAFAESTTGDRVLVGCWSTLAALAAGAGGSEAFYLHQKAVLQKQFDQESEKLEASKKRLELLEDAYNLNK
jgi:hypothetical protein